MAIAAAPFPLLTGMTDYWKRAVGDANLYMTQPKTPPQFRDAKGAVAKRINLLQLLFLCVVQKNSEKDMLL